MASNSGTKAKQCALSFAEQKELNERKLSWKTLPLRDYFHQNTTTAPMILCFDRVRGRHVRARKPINKATILMKITPYISMPLDCMEAHICHTCLKDDLLKEKESIQCEQCQIIRWCSRQCKEKQEILHQIECETMKRIRQMKSIEGERASIKAVARLLIMKKLETETTEQVRQRIMNKKEKDQKSHRKKHIDMQMIKPAPGKCWTDMKNLLTHRGDLPETTLDTLKTAMQRLVPLLETDFSGSVDECIDIYLQIHANAHKVVDESDNRPRAIALYLPAAVMNHSCLPNCQYRFQDGVMQVTTAVDVRADEELTYNYIPIYLPRTLRNERLRQMFSFVKCYCQRCSEPYEKSDDRYVRGILCSNDGTLLTCKATELQNDGVCATCKLVFAADELIAAEQKVYDEMMLAAKFVEADDIESAECHLVELIASDSKLHPFHFLRYEIDCTLINLHRKLKNWAGIWEAASRAKRALEQMKMTPFKEMADVCIEAGDAAFRIWKLGGSNNDIVYGAMRAEWKLRASENLARCLAVISNCVDNNNPQMCAVREILADLD